MRPIWSRRFTTLRRDYLRFQGAAAPARKKELENSYCRRFHTEYLSQCHHGRAGDQLPFVRRRGGLLYYLLRVCGWAWQASIRLSVALASGFFRLLASEAHADILTYAVFLAGLTVVRACDSGGDGRGVERSGLRSLHDRRVVAAARTLDATDGCRRRSRVLRLDPTRVPVQLARPHQRLVSASRLSPLPGIGRDLLLLICGRSPKADGSGCTEWRALPVPPSYYACAISILPFA